MKYKIGPMSVHKSHSLKSICDRKKLRRKIMTGENPLFVFSMTRSGSRSLAFSLGDSFPICCIGHHMGLHSRNRYLSMHRFYGNNINKLKLLPVIISYFSWPSLAIAKNPVTLLTTIREPVAREISLFVRISYRNNPTFIMESPIEVIYERFAIVRKKFPDITTAWFEKEYEKDTGVDVYQFPFNKELGCGNFDNGKIKGFIVKSESTKNPEKNSQIARELSVFLQKDFFNIIPALPQDSANKVFMTRYNEIIDNFVAPDEYLGNVYNSKYMKHFYTEEEIAAFRAKWKHETLSTSLNFDFAHYLLYIICIIKANPSFVLHYHLDNKAS